MALMLTPATAAAVTPTLYTSQDEGASWRVVPTGRTLFGFIFCDTSHAWASDAYGNIWASADSGLTWAKLPSQPV